MPWPTKGVTHAQLGLTEKGRRVEWLAVCNGWELEPLDHSDFVVFIFRALSILPQNFFFTYFHLFTTTSWGLYPCGSYF